jgi:anti-sigma B factor antagonist
MSDESSILVSQTQGIAYIKVVGRGSFKNARYMKAFVDKMAELGTANFVLDLHECVHMDSTFMGTIAGINLNIRKMHAPPLRVVNTNERSLELLQNLGLDKILQIDAKPTDLSTSAFEPIPQQPPPSKEQLSQTVLDAHQALAKVDIRNQIRFQEVVTFLREKLGVQDV